MTTGRITVHHLGRAGDIPGGMTQVVNAYLGWSFDQVDTAVITSRGNPHDHVAAARNAAAALVKVARLPRATSVVVGHLSERGSFLREGTMLRLARARGIGTVAHLHGASFAEFAARYPRLTRWALGASDRIISLSEGTSLVAARSVPMERIELIPNAIPTAAAADKTDVIVFGGVVSRRKGVDVLLDAWEQLPDHHGWRLLIAGPVRDAEVVREVDGVEFLGSLGHDDLMALLASSRVAVLPSRDEAMPMFILEAMARRNCVIATTVGGIGPVLADGRGLLVAPADVTGLSDALSASILDGELRDGTADRALAAFDETYSATAVFPRVEQLWLDAHRVARERRSGR